MKNTAIILGSLYLLSLTNCTNTLKHEIQLKIDLADPCLTAFPVCGPEGYTCESPEGVSEPSCTVTCVAASSRECRSEGPVCLQLDEEVPVLCTAKDEE